jgi:Catalytic LigB subunit of aromatic ring-opening dioxygenase
MAEIVAAMGVPHTPMFPALVARLGPECEVARLYAEVARQLAVHDRLAAHLRHGGVEAGFDLALAQDFTVDHSIMVPLHFLTPQMQTPVVPMFINGLVPPLPAAKRCFALGEAVRKAIHRWPQGGCLDHRANS